MRGRTRGRADDIEPFIVELLELASRFDLQTRTTTLYPGYRTAKQIGLALNERFSLVEKACGRLVQDGKLMRVLMADRHHLFANRPRKGM